MKIENENQLRELYGFPRGRAKDKVFSTLDKHAINAELYPDTSKIKKQMNYANKRNIPFVVLVGDKELKSNIYTLKNMNSGEQETVSFKELVGALI